MEDNKQIGYPANIEVGDNTSFWVEGDCLNSSDAPMRLQDGQKLIVHRLEDFNPYTDIEKVRGKVCVIIYHAKGMRCAVVKEIVGLDEIAGSLRLKYYNPKVTIVQLKIDKIESIYLVEGVKELEEIPIDFDKTLEYVADWHKQWCCSRYGSDSLNPERYYKISKDGRYLYGVKEGESLNDRKATIDRVLELLLRLRLINQKLNGKGLSQHLQWKEQEQLKREREGLYKEFLDVVQADFESQQPEPKQCLIDLLPDHLKSDEVVEIFQRAIDAKMIEKTATGLKWLQIGSKGGKAQLAYFCGKLFGYEYSAYGNKGKRVPYKELEELFGVNRLDRALKQVWDAKEPQRWRVKIDALFK